MINAFRFRAQIRLALVLIADGGRDGRFSLSDVSKLIRAYLLGRTSCKIDHLDVPA
jgi:hypothetical protein